MAENPTIDELKAHINSLEKTAEGVQGIIRKAENDAETIRRKTKDEAGKPGKKDRLSM